MVSTAQTPLEIESLLRPEAYPHSVRYLRLLETHISWVILTGDYAYKFKKPLDLGFLDFSTLERREHFCREEVRLNSRTAPELYRGVVRLTGSPQYPRFEGTGETLEFALRMREFPQSNLMTQVLADGRLGTRRIHQIATQVAEFHEIVQRAPCGARFGRPDLIQAPALENFDHLQRLVTSVRRRKCLRALRNWTENEYFRLIHVFWKRKMDGSIRECHGDLHLGNIAEMDGHIFLFDCIEFCDDLRWTDVQADIAFLFSDLEHHRRKDLAWKFLNAYLERTGDFDGLALLRYYAVYRTMVRAKIAAIRLEQSNDPAGLKELDGYLAQASATTDPKTPRLVLTRGPSGAGKTCLSRELVPRIGAVHLRSDVERKRLFGLGARQASGSGLHSGIYSATATERTYERLAKITERLLAAGWNVCVDATFLKPQELEPFQSLGARFGVPVRVLDLRVDPEVLMRRVRNRAGTGRNASEADAGVLRAQLQGYDYLEGPGVIPVNGPMDLGQLVAQLRRPSG